MKKIFICLALLVAAVRVQAQGTVVFYNHVNLATTHIYGPEADGTVAINGNAANDRAAGAAVYHGTLIGGTATGPYAGQNFSAQLWFANGFNQPESSLLGSTNNYTTTSFSTSAGGGGFIVQTNATPDPGLDGPNAAPSQATLQLRVWFNAGNTITNWGQAVSSNVMIGKSTLFNLNLGNQGVPASVPVQLAGLTSFNLHTNAVISGPLGITTQPAGSTIQCGGSGVVSVTASGNPPLTYQWYQGNTLLPNSTSSINFAPANVANSGSYTVVVTDNTGSVTSTPPAVVVVQDTLAPVITVIGANPYSLTLHTTFTDPGATANDACQGVTSVTTNGAVNKDVVGAYTLTYTSTDSSLNSASVTRVVNVVDNIPPAITTSPTNQVVECHTGVSLVGGASGSPTLAYQWYFNGAKSSINPSTNAVLSIAFASAANVGSYSLVVTNAYGAATSAVAVITVVDTTPPNVTILGSNPQTVECHGTFTDAGATASDACAGTLAVTSNGVVNVNITGDYTVTYSANDGHQSGSATRVVHVTDTTGPVITVLGSNPATVQCHTAYVDAGATANDACAGPKSVATSGTVNTNNPGNYTMTYISTDGANATTNTRVVQVIDTVGPVITVLGSNPATVQCHTAYTDAGATANDACAGPESVATSGTVNTNNPGNYTMTYISTDGANATTNTRVVQVIDAVGPVITVLGSNPATVQCHTAYNDAGATATDACAGPQAVVTSGTVSTNSTGNYTITYVSTDGANATTNTRVVQVIDAVGPVITVLGSNPATVECHTAYTDAGATATDACAGPESVTTSGTVNTNSPGNYTMTYISTDGANATTNTRVVQVIDTIAPVITLFGSNPMLTPYQAVFTDPGATASDACAGPEPVTITGTVDTNTLGSYTLTYVATDGANSTTNTRVVNVTLGVPQITGVSASQNANAGMPLVLTVTNTGSAPFGYIWSKNGTNLVNSTLILGADTSSLTVTNVSRPVAGNYQVIVTNVYASVTSAPIVITVSDPAILVQPADVTLLKGQTHVFSVLAAGSGTLKYQWYSVSNSTSTLLKGKTASTLSEVLTTTNLGYYVVITNQLPVPNSVTSRTAVATVLVAPVITGQPASFVGKAAKIAGNNVIFSVKVATNATKPLVYQWYKDGQILTGEMATNLTLINVQSDDAGSYSCIVTNLGGSATTKPVAGILAVLPDVVPPITAFTYPKAGQRLTNGQPYTLGTTTLIAPAFSLAGTVSDKGLVSSIIVQRIYPADDQISVSETIPGPGKVGWTNTLTLKDGTNIFITYAVDYAGNLSKTNTRTFFYVNNTTMLNVTNVGAGTNIPAGKAGDFAKFGTPANGAMLEIGRNYAIKAVAAGNNVFTNWTDTNGIQLTTNVQLTFRMSSNLVLTANFITNPIVASHADGKYNGLFSESFLFEPASKGVKSASFGPPNVTVETAGSILNLVVKTNRTFSGKLNLQGKTFTMSGTFDTSGDATFSVSRKSAKLPGLSTQLHLDWSGESRQITGSINGTNSENRVWFSDVVLDQATFNATNEADFYGLPARYTVTLPGGGDGTNSPAGDGYLGMTNTLAGNSIISGKLADGTTVAQSVPISQDGDIPVSIKLNNGLGLLQGWLSVDEDSVDGVLTWIRGSTNIPATYVQGLTNLVVANGNRYVKPTAPATVFGSDTNLVVTVFDAEGFSHDTNGNPLSWNVQLKGNSFVTVVAGSSTNKLSGTVSTADGSVSLTFKTTGTDKTGTKAMKGMINQNSEGASGYFIGNTNTGGFYLQQAR